MPEALPEVQTFKSFDGTNIAYYDSCGDDYPIIVLHGLLSRASAMTRLISLLGKRGLRGIGVDIRGHRNSDAPENSGAYLNQAMARDIIALGEHRELNKYAISAYGLGCELTARCANLDAPITHAVMCGWGGAPTDQLDLYASKEWHAQAIRLAEGLETDNPEAITDDMARAWRGAADNNGTNRFALAARLRSGDSGEPGLNPLNIDVPVLVICGEEDKDPHEFAAALPNATGKVVRGGHATAARDPELFVAAADFLAKEVSQ